MARRPDALAAALCAGLALAVIGGGAALVSLGFAQAWELITALGVGAVLVAGHRSRETSAALHNGQIHGAARPARASEAIGAAQGRPDAPPLDQHEFRD